MDWQVIRDDFPASTHHVYLNTAGIGITPLPVTVEMQRLLGAWSAHGATTPVFRDELGELERRARERAAELFRASPHELAFTGRVAESLHIVVDGLSWHSGDEVITSDEEVIYAPLYRLAQEHGVVVKRMTLPHDREELLKRFQSLLSSRTRFVWLSDTTNKTGIHLPTKEICALAHERGALVMFDGAQTAGQFPLDLHAMGCDAYAITGYKWLLGPYGCGLCYIRQEALAELRPHRLGRGELDHERCAYTPDPTARAFEFSVRNLVLRCGFGSALAYLAAMGIEAIWQRTMALRDYLWGELDALSGVRIASPRDPALNSAITCAIVEGIEPRAVVEAAWRANVVIVPTEVPAGRDNLRGVRISPAFYNTTEDLDRVLDVIRSLLAAR
ncbi:MAG: aminotransferase class V-fold PLP-dependent enzyme [Chloroflexi bacterium]|nr:aminotransferase class V-fold PLP-dependent enzyme [Chloroflexota bacterium]